MDYNSFWVRASASFEERFAHYCNVKYCVALNSGTSALHLGDGE